MQAKIFKIAETSAKYDNIAAALKELGAPDWLNTASIATDAELLTEFAGRLCYKSFVVGLNPNVTKVREGNREYLANVLKQKHGSVFEHATVSYLLVGVSRILTHELVRHRAGTAFSQESQRYVRLDQVSVYVPDLTPALEDIGKTLGMNDPELWAQEEQGKLLRTMEVFANFGEEKIVQLVNDYHLNEAGITFAAKKAVTSALRRLLPAGVVTNILVTANHRTWRHILAARTAPGAEVEIREVMTAIGLELMRDYPNIYQDASLSTLGDDIPYIVFQNEKV